MKRVSLAGVICLALFLALGSHAGAFSISGRILSYKGKIGATLDLTGPVTATANSVSQGYYQSYTFTGLPNGVYTVIPRETHQESFTPTSRMVTINEADVIDQDFNGNNRPWSVSGTVRIEGVGLAEVAITNGVGTTYTTTDNIGNYTASLANSGIYGFVAVKPGYNFNPPLVNINLGYGDEVVGLDFTAIRMNYWISGTVTNAGVGMSGVKVALKGGGWDTTTSTDGSGNYVFYGFAWGGCTLTASKSGYIFSPQNRNVFVNGADVPGQDFAVTTTNYSLSGTLTYTGAILYGVTINITGPVTKSTTTGTQMTYSFSDLPNGSYTVTPSKTGYTFTPPSRSVTINGSNITGQDFSATLAGNFTISGAVMIGGVALSGVMVNLTGASEKSATTDSSGDYSFAGLSNGDYTITPAKAGYTFTPESRTANVNGGNVSGLNFDAMVRKYLISGTVSKAGSALQGVTIKLTGAATKSKTTDIKGNYSFTGLSGGSYTLTPSKTGFTFTPPETTLTVGETDATGQDFTAAPTLPGKTALVAPSGAISTRTPTYTWNPDPYSTSYYLWVDDKSGNKIKTWYTATQARCAEGSGACSVTPGTALVPGSATWRVQTRNKDGEGPWSDDMGFVVPSSGGFFQQFNSGNAPSWLRDSGTWNVLSKAFYYTSGVADMFSTSTYNKKFSDFDYVGRLKVNGSYHAGNQLFVRAGGTVMPDGTLSNCYCFDFRQHGKFSVWKRFRGGPQVMLQNWTASSAINPGSAWNVVRARAIGPNLWFYINGTLVWSGTDSSLSTGRVGVGVYRDNNDTEGGLWVDWASLSSIDADTVGASFMEAVDPEQQQLNEALERDAEKDWSP